MAKTNLLVFILIAAFTGNVFSGEWDYVPNVELQYMSNANEDNFRNAGTATFDGFRQISKLPKEVTQALHEALESYDLDVGDWFTFSCGYEWTSPKEIRAVVRITSIKNDGSYTYSFYAWQKY